MHIDLETRDEFIARMKFIQSEIDRDTEEFIAERNAQVENEVKPAIAEMTSLEARFILHSNYCIDTRHGAEAKCLLEKWFDYSRRSYGFFNGHREFSSHVLALGGYIEKTLDANTIWRALNDQINLYEKLPEAREIFDKYRREHSPRRQA